MGQTSVQASEQRGRTAGVRLRPAWRAVGIMILVKVLVLLLGVIAWQIINDRAINSWQMALAIWNLWDAPHYRDLAEFGYSASGEQGLFIVFYPLYPWLVGLIGWPFHNYLLGAFLVSTLASLATAALLCALTGCDHDETIALRSVWFFAIFPASYFLHIGYTESLFIALTLGAFLAARDERWPIAGLLGGLAALTRVNGLLLLPALAVEVAMIAWQTRRADWRWLWLALIPLGAGGYLLLNWGVTGNPLAFSDILRDHWYKSPSWPWQGIGDLVRSFSWRPVIEQQTVVVQQIFFLLLGLIGTIACWIRLRPSYAFWMTLNLLLYTSTTFILSIPRYTLTLFPLFILSALLARRPFWDRLLTLWSLLFLALFTILFLMQRGLAY